MTRPGIEPWFPGLWANTLLIRPNAWFCTYNNCYFLLYSNRERFAIIPRVKSNLTYEQRLLKENVT